MAGPPSLFARLYFLEAARAPGKTKETAAPRGAVALAY
jgi:hypothetical protein